MHVLLTGCPGYQTAWVTFHYKLHSFSVVGVGCFFVVVVVVVVFALLKFVGVLRTSKLADEKLTAFSS